MPAKLNLPSLSDLSEDPDERYSELEDHIQRLEGRLERRIVNIEKSVKKLRKQEEIILKQEGIDYDYFDWDEEIKPRKLNRREVDTLSGRVVLYDIDDTSFKLLSMKIKEKIGAMMESAYDKLEPINEVYQEFMSDFAIRYSTLVPVGVENSANPLALVYCIGNNDMVMHVQVDVKTGYHLPTHEEEGTLEEYLSKERQDELLQDHTMCDHNQYLLTHPSDIFDHDRLSIVSFAVVKDRYFKMNPDAEIEAELEAEVAKAQDINTRDISSIFSAIGRATRDPLGVGESDDSEGMLN